MQEKIYCYIFDLHSGRLDDLKWEIWALINESWDSEKTLIVILIVLSLGGNELKMVEVKPKKKKLVEEGEEKKEEEKEDEEKKMKKKRKIKNKKKMKKLNLN